MSTSGHKHVDNFDPALGIQLVHVDGMFTELSLQLSICLYHTHANFLRLDKRACLDNPCKNAGTCTELGQGDFTCTCAVGSKGNACECKCCSFLFCTHFIFWLSWKMLCFHLIFTFLLYMAFLRFRRCIFFK